MQIIFPEYYEKFSCIGGDCEDTCCKGWSIKIDKKTYFRYQKIKEKPFRDELPGRVKRIKGGEASDASYAKFLLNEDGKCSFLLENGLCGVQKAYGETYLSDTCRAYPRVLNQTGKSASEVCLTMSCVEAARTALFSPEPMGFQSEERERREDLPCLNDLEAILSGENAAYASCAWDIREAVIDMLQERTYSIPERILAIGMLLNKINELHRLGQHNAVPSTAQLYLHLMKEGKIAEGLAGFKLPEGREMAVTQFLYRLVYVFAQKMKTHHEIFREVCDAITVGEYSNREGDFDWEIDYLYIRSQIDRRFPDFLAQKGYVLENYLVNYAFSTLFPFGYIQKGLDVYQHFILLAEQFALFRLLVCCTETEAAEIRDTLLVRAAAALSTVNQHTEAPGDIIKVYRDNQLDDPAQMAFLLL